MGWCRKLRVDGRKGMWHGGQRQVKMSVHLKPELQGNGDVVGGRIHPLPGSIA